MADLNGKTVLITAAGQGIGRATRAGLRPRRRQGHRHRHQRGRPRELAGQANVTTRHLDVLDTSGRQRRVCRDRRDRRAVQLRRLRPCRLDPRDERRRSGLRLRPQRQARCSARSAPCCPACSSAAAARSSTCPRSPAVDQGRAQPLRLWRDQGGRHRADQGGRRRLCRQGHPLQRDLPGHGREPVAARSACRRRATTRRRAPPSSRASRWAGSARPRRSPTSPSIWPARPIRPARPTYRRRLDDLIRIQRGRETMKLLRYGEVGQRTAGPARCGMAPSAISPAIVADIAGTTLDPDSLADAGQGRSRKRCRWFPASPRIGACVAGTGKFICIGLNYSDHAAETGATVPPEPIIFMKATLGDRRPERRRAHPARLGKDRLGGRARRRHRQDGQICQRSRRARLCRRLLRRHTTSPSAPSRPSAQGQWTKGKCCDTFGPIGPWLVTKDEVRRSAEPEDVADGQRQDDAERLDQDHGLRRRATWCPISASSCRCSPATSSRPARRPASAWA